MYSVTFVSLKLRKGKHLKKLFLSQFHKMAGKKKTVKHLNGDLNDFAVKFKQFEEVLKGILKLEGIKDLDKKLAALDRNVDNEKRIKDLEEEVSCLTSVEKQF